MRRLPGRKGGDSLVSGGRECEGEMERCLSEDSGETRSVHVMGQRLRSAFAPELVQF